jgi:UDP-N-acetylmuramate--alanine ligase
VHYPYLVGIKGTGMASLGVLLSKMGLLVRGCDRSERFITDELLLSNGIAADEGFGADLLPPETDLVIHSSAYGAHTEILRTARERGIETISYPDFVAGLSRRQPSWAVSGTHGKTTTVAVATHLLSTLRSGAFPFYALYGSHGQTTPYWGDEVALFEACEYQDHFLSYELRGVVITTIDWDHPDYFESLDQVEMSFESLILRLEEGGVVIYNADDTGVATLVTRLATRRSDLTCIPYGFTEAGPFTIVQKSLNQYSLAIADDSQFSLTVSAKELIADHIAALILAASMVLDHRGERLTSEEKSTPSHALIVAELAAALASYEGTAGRLEIVHSEDGVLYLDDYAHHPAEIKVLKTEIAHRFGAHKHVYLFSPHTASRTISLLDDFIAALADLRRLIIQSTYASAREDSSDTDPAFELYQRVQALSTGSVFFAYSDDEAIEKAASWLQEGSVCITMGAGNNRLLGAQIAALRRSFT